MAPQDSRPRPGVVGIVAAGGRGERLGADSPKAFVSLAGRPMLDWSVDVLRQACTRVIVAVPAGLEAGDPHRVTGGSSRSQSVRNALEAAPEAELVVVHDAARPLVSRELVEACIAGVSDGFDGAIAAVRMTDTVKEADADGGATRTLDRSRLWAVQTPQVFRADALWRGLDVSGEELARATDDASLVEASGGRVRLVEAPRENLKVTAPLDLRVAEAILASRC
jgi:2-C-methyl-D-erythritol 4-phosphate cytidylyltransferase